MTAKNSSLEVRAREFFGCEVGLSSCSLGTTTFHGTECPRWNSVTGEYGCESLTALLTAVASEAVAGERGVVGKDAFDARMKALEELPLVKSLLGAKLTFEKWSPTLQRDAYLKMGLEPVVMYRVVAEVDPHRKKPTVGGAS